MRVEYSKRAITDLRRIAAYYARSGNPAAAARIAARIQEVIARIAAAPLSRRPPMVQRQAFALRCFSPIGTRFYTG
jgi:plasmid stabilization system protein ParE